LPVLIGYIEGSQGIDLPLLGLHLSKLILEVAVLLLEDVCGSLVDKEWILRLAAAQTSPQRTFDSLTLSYFNFANPSFYKIINYFVIYQCLRNPF